MSKLFILLFYSRAKAFTSEIIKKFKDNSFTDHLLILDLLDYIIDFSKLSFHNQIASKDFMQNFLILVKIKEKPLIQAKVLYLIKKWANKFSEQKELSIFSDTFNSLKKSGVVFPENSK